MKTSWSAQYLEVKHGVAGSKKFMRDKVKGLMESTGIKWTWNNYHARYVVMPVVSKDNWKNPTLNVEDINAMKKAYQDVADKTFGVSITSLKKELNWDWVRVMETVSAIVKSGEYSPQVERQGHCCNIRLKN